MIDSVGMYAIQFATITAAANVTNQPHELRSRVYDLSGLDAPCGAGDRAREVLSLRLRPLLRGLLGGLRSLSL